MAVSLRHRCEYAGFLLVWGVLAALPLDAAMRLAAWVADVAIRLDRRHRRIGLVNLGFAFPEKSEPERLAILRASYRNLGRMAAECAHLHRTDAAASRARVRFDDEAAWRRHLRDHLDRGAVLVFTAHFGNWELFHHAYAFLDEPITLVHQTIKNPLVDAFVERLRTYGGTRLLRKHGAAREVLRALRGRGPTVLAIDQNASRRTGIFVDFFGVPASTNAAFGRIAIRTEVPVVPAFLVREGTSARHRIVILPPVTIASMADRDSAAVELTARCTAVLEDVIRAHPDHWLWTHKRWRTRPLGAPEIYRA